MPRSAIERSRHRIGAIPAPPPTKTMLVSGASRKVKTPNGRLDVVQRITIMTPYYSLGVTIGTDWDFAFLTEEFGPAKTKKEAEHNVVRAIDHTAKRLGNTRTVCRKYYIHPTLIEAYLKGHILPPMPRRTSRMRRKPGGKLRKHEKHVLAFLRATGKGKRLTPTNRNGA